MEELIDMNSGIDLSYEDVLKSYQQKSGELLTQLITAEAKLNASASLIISLKERVDCHLSIPRALSQFNFNKPDS